MQGKWKRFGAFLAAVIAIIAMTSLGVRGQSLSTSEVVVLVALIGLIAYLLTFVVWPRRSRSQNLESIDATRTDGPQHPRIERPYADQRPVAIIQPRPAGSRPGSRVHIPENPMERNARGRRLDGRQPNREFQWPAQR